MTPLRPRTIRENRIRYLAHGAPALYAHSMARCARIGFVAGLHAWGQKLDHHPHVYCLEAGRFAVR